jgi:D-3-phosphoglycerate dehydrogenase / 2-oxoglutarate reductase
MLAEPLTGARVVRLNCDLFPVDDYEAELYRRYGLQPSLVGSLPPDDFIPYVADCDAVIVVSGRLPRHVIERMRRCRVISRRGTGTDRIDVETATRLGILVTNVPRFCEDEIAEHTMLLLLALARQLPLMSAAMYEGGWTRVRRAALEGNHRLAGQTLGLVGFGAGARAVARRAAAFGLRVLATRRNLAAPDPEAAALNVEMVNLETLLVRSDYVSLHLPLTPATRHLLDDAHLRLMKPTAYLINTARGAIVDELALVAALREGRLVGAGLDTFEQIDVFGPDGRPDHPLLELDNVILTPHVAAESVESRQESARGAIGNLVSVLSGRWPNPEHIVNTGVAPRWSLGQYDPTIYP